VPEVLAVTPGVELRLEWLDAGPLDDAAFGAALAALHDAGAPAHGWTPGPGDELVLGELRLPAGPAPTHAASLTARLEHLVGEADRRGALPAGGATRIAATVARLDVLLPDVPPARLHGDLWTGNVLGGAPDGRPQLVDPAAHGGDAETDLAMLALFGTVSDRFLRGYEERRPLPDGRAERVALHQLGPLLVHAVLFGGGYGAQAVAAATAGA
jgi:fructosamine-3-kinase